MKTVNNPGVIDVIESNILLDGGSINFTVITEGNRKIKYHLNKSLNYIKNKTWVLTIDDVSIEPGSDKELIIIKELDKWLLSRNDYSSDYVKNIKNEYINQNNSNLINEITVISLIEEICLTRLKANTSYEALCDNFKESEPF